MRIVTVVIFFITVIAFSACQSSVSMSIPTAARFSTETFVFIPSPQFVFDTPIPTATKIFTPKVTATPINIAINSDGDFEKLIEKLYPFCIGHNDAKSTAVWAPSHLEFIETDVQPDPHNYWVSEIADNVDKTRQAFVACKPDLCQDQIYIKENITGKVYEIDWEFRMPWRPIQLVTWINNNIFAFFQSANPTNGHIIAINFDTKEYLYSAIVFPDYYCSTATVTP